MSNKGGREESFKRGNLVVKIKMASRKPRGKGAEEWKIWMILYPDGRKNSDDREAHQDKQDIETYTTKDATENKFVELREMLLKEGWESLRLHSRRLNQHPSRSIDEFLAMLRRPEVTQ